MPTIDLSFLKLPANGETYDVGDEEIGAALARGCRKAAGLVHAVMSSQGADNLDEYEPDHCKGSYVDDMVDLAREARGAGVTIIWPGGVEPTYEGGV
jgi:hypothetical protein